MKISSARDRGEQRVQVLLEDVAQDALRQPLGRRVDRQHLALRSVRRRLRLASTTNSRGWIWRP